MTTRLKLTKNGFEAKRWDGEARQEHAIKKVEDGYRVIEKATDKEVLRALTRDEADELFWVEEEIEFMWPRLREGVELEEGVTVDDLLKAIRSHEELEALCNLLFPHWEQFNYEGAEVYRTCCVMPEDDRFYTSNETNLLNQNKLVIRSTMQLTSVDGVVAEGEYHMSLLEVLDALFGEKRLLWDDPVDLLSIPIGMDSLSYLLRPVSIEEGTTVQDIFDMVDSNEDLKQFIAMYSWCRPIDEFHKEAKNPPLDDMDVEELDDYSGRLTHTRIDRYFEFHPKSAHVGEYWSEWVDFGAIGECSKETRGWYEEKGEEPPDHENYGIGFSRTYRYSRLPLKVSETFKIQQGPSYSRKGNVKESGKILAVAQAPYTLLDILDAIYWEISFYGGPGGRDEQLEELCDRVDEAKADLDRGKTFKSVDELFDELDSDD
jgi:hypothetical protein